MLQYEEEKTKKVIEKLEDENSAFGMYATRLLFDAEAYAA